MKPKGTNEPNDGIFFTGTSISDAESWYSSLIRHFRESQAEKKNPTPRATITAAKDMSALDKLVQDPSEWSSLVSQIRDSIEEWRNPHKTVTTAELVDVQEIWTKNKTGVPKVLSVFGHVLVVVLLIIPWATYRSAPPAIATNVMLSTPLILNLPKLDDASGGGGGGGKHLLTPASKGVLPKAADKQFVPPSVEPPKNLDPTLVMEATVVAPQLAQLPSLNLLNIGDPNGVAGPPSSGSGTGGGIGNGTGHGVGSGNGPGVGPGEGGGYGGGVFKVGGSVSAPTIIHKVDPQYSEEARKARYQGTVVLEAIVQKDGSVQIVRVVRSLGFGLDEKAQEALRQWKFSPAKQNGVAVAVSLNIEVNFNLR